MHSIRSFVSTALNREDSKTSQYFASLLAFATLISVIATMSESVHTFSSYTTFFLSVEWFTTILFTIEYLARIWVSPNRMQYICSYLGFTDLASIVPTFLGVGNLAFLKTARIVRTLRIMRLVGQTNISHVQKKSASLYSRFQRGPILAFGLLLIGICICFLWFAYNESLTITQTFEIFIGYEAAPMSMGLLTAIILVKGKVLAALCLGFLLGWGIEMVRKR